MNYNDVSYNSLNEFKRNIRVFIIDDSLFTCGRLIDLLSSVEGVKVAGISRNSNEAQVMIDEIKPEVVILEAVLSRGSSADLLLNIKQDMPATTTVVFTDYYYPENVEECENNGADYVFNKLTDFDSLIDLLLKISVSDIYTTRYFNKQKDRIEAEINI